MPQRPQQHELDQEACDQFRIRVPRNWQHRELKPDYGTDFQIEFFSDGSATGHLMHVQVKGTDSLDREGRIQIEIDRLQYLRQLDIPAILVQWCATSKKLYWTWLWDAMSQIKKHDALTVTIIFKPENELKTDKFPEEIASTVANLRSLKRRQDNLKLGLRIEQISEPGELGFWLNDFCITASYHSEIFELDYQSSGAKIEFTIDRSTVTVAIEGIFSTKHSVWGDDIEPSYDSKLAIGNALHSLISTLRTIGLFKHAEMVAEYVAERSIQGDNLAHSLDALLSLMHRPALAVDYAIFLNLAHDPNFGLRVFLSDAHRKWRNLHDLRRLSNLLEHLSNRIEVDAKTQLSFDILDAEILTSCHDYEKALQAVKRCKRSCHLPRGDKDTALLAIRILFGLERFHTAIRYTRLLKKNFQDTIFSLFYADALLLAGNFTSARQELIGIYQGCTSSQKHEIDLRFLMLNYLICVEEQDEESEKRIHLHEVVTNPKLLDRILPAAHLYHLLYKETVAQSWSDYLGACFEKRDIPTLLYATHASAIRHGFSPFTSFAEKHLIDVPDEFKFKLFNYLQILAAAACAARSTDERELVQHVFNTAAFHRLSGAMKEELTIKR